MAVPAAEVEGAPPVLALEVWGALCGDEDSDGRGVTVEGCTVQGIGATL